MGDEQRGAQSSIGRARNRGVRAWHRRDRIHCSYMIRSDYHAAPAALELSSGFYGSLARGFGNGQTAQLAPGKEYILTLTLLLAPARLRDARALHRLTAGSPGQ